MPLKSTNFWLKFCLNPLNFDQNSAIFCRFLADFWCFWLDFRPYFIFFVSPAQAGLRLEIAGKARKLKAAQLLCATYIV
jgi:hypothetical protein